MSAGVPVPLLKKIKKNKNLDDQWCRNSILCQWGSQIMYTVFPHIV